MNLIEFRFTLIMFKELVKTHLNILKMNIKLLRYETNMGALIIKRHR
jgi:hypothetical protein